MRMKRKHVKIKRKRVSHITAENYKEKENEENENEQEKREGKISRTARRIKRE